MHAVYTFEILMYGNTNFNFIYLGGFIKHPTNQQRFYLQFEVKQFDRTIPLVTINQNRVGKYMKVQHIRNWIKVSRDELKDIRVCELEDENGVYYISNTSWYVPEWLQESETTEIDDLPADSLVVHTVENDPEFRTQIEHNIA